MSWLKKEALAIAKEVDRGCGCCGYEDDDVLAKKFEDFAHKFAERALKHVMVTEGTYFDDIPLPDSAAAEALATADKDEP